MKSAPGLLSAQAGTPALSGGGAGAGQAASAESAAGTVSAVSPVSVELLKSVEQFVYHEARCMDEHRYDEWLALWEPEMVYWVPCDDDDVDPASAVCIVYDRRRQLEQRITRLKGRFAFAQQPRTRLIRVVSNVSIESVHEDVVVATSTFSLGDWRSERQTTWFGRNRHVLKARRGGFGMCEKKVLLLNNSGALGNLTFLI